MTCAIRIEAHSLITHLRDLAAPNTMTSELRKRVADFLHKIDTISEVGIYKVSDPVYFDPQCLGKNFIPAKIVASYCTSDGRVLYDLAIRFGRNEDGTPRYAETMPVRDVVPSFIRSQEEVDLLMRQPAEQASTQPPSTEPE